MSGPLQGVRVIEMAGIGPGPFAAMLLADLGAEVICIDRKPSAGGGGLDKVKQSADVIGRGRRSLVLDLKNEQAVAALMRMIEGADVLIEGFRPGVMERLGLGPEACHARNPRLVYGRMTGWGQDGPLSRSAGHDINYIAIAGALHGMGPKDRPPVVPLNLVGDYGGGGLLLAFGVVAALFEARGSGAGQVVDAAMSDGAATLMTMFYGLAANGTWSSEREANFLDGAAHFYSTYACADGRFISLGAIEPQFYQLLLSKLELHDPAFASQWRQASWPGLRTQLAELFKTRTRDEWCELLEGSDVCFAPVLDLQEAPRHPHNIARGTFTEVDGIVQPAPSPRFSRTPGRIRHAAPAAGSDTRDVLLGAGFSASEVEALIREGGAYASP